MTTQLVPLFAGTIAGETTELVNARELHSFLESQQQFSHWIQDRIEQYEFTQDVDFTVIDNFIYDVAAFGGKRKTVDYHLTLDMAKELSMVERNAKGKQARRYFIDCEKNLYYNALPRLLNPVNKTMTVTEFRQWQSSVKTTLNLVIKESIKSISVITSADDYLDFVMGKNTHDTNRLIKGIDTHESHPATNESSQKSHNQRRWRKNEVQQLIGYYEHGLTYDEIALKLGRSRSSVGNAIMRHLNKGGAA